LLRYNVKNPMSGFGNGSTAGPVFDRRFTQSNSVNYNPGSARVRSGVGSGNPLASMLLGDCSTGNYNVAFAYATQQIYLERLVLAGWKLNGDLKMANGNLISAPSNVNIIGPTGTAHRS